MPAPAEPLRRLPVPTRLIARETIGSFLTRLAFANALRVPHLLALAAITTSMRSFSPSTNDTRGWSETTPDRIAALAGRPLPELAAAIPLLDTMTPADTTPLRACGHCTAARNVTGMVIVGARARDYLCLRAGQGEPSAGDGRAYRERNSGGNQGPSSWAALIMSQAGMGRLDRDASVRISRRGRRAGRPADGPRRAGRDSRPDQARAGRGLRASGRWC